MKIKFYLIIILSVINNFAYSWDNEAAKYFPLCVGNIWIYSGRFQSGMIWGIYKSSYKVTGITDTLGKRYYKIQNKSVILGGSSGGIIPFIKEYIRIDSGSMNIYELYFYCNLNEVLKDSIRASIYDTNIVCSTNLGSTCYDTAIYPVFGLSYPTKRFSKYYGPSIRTYYVKNIGIVFNGWGYTNYSVVDSLKGCVINGVLYGDTSMPVGLEKISGSLPIGFNLHQNYPNPFNPITKIRFEIPKMDSRFRGNDNVRLVIYNSLGEEITTLVNQQLSPGAYEYEWDGTNYPSGMYFYRLSTNGFFESKKMILIK